MDEIKLSHRLTKLLFWNMLGTNGFKSIAVVAVVGFEANSTPMRPGPIS